MCPLQFFVSLLGINLTMFGLAVGIVDHSSYKLEDDVWTFIAIHLKLLYNLLTLLTCVVSRVSKLYKSKYFVQFTPQHWEQVMIYLKKPDCVKYLIFFLFRFWCAQCHSHILDVSIDTTHIKIFQAD